MIHLLDNIAWHALSGPQGAFATGAGNARRYAPGFSPIVGFADTEHPDFEALAPYCQPGEHLYCDGWSGPAPAGWRIDADTTMFKMVWDGAAPEADAAPEAERLGPRHATQAFELAMLTKPGPFGARTTELGEYFGVVEDGRLIAMAGERMFTGRLREISGVCTHPEAQRKGHARRLILGLIRRQMQRGETPFLHVMCSNVNAARLYERMGFVVYKESVVRVISTC